MKVFIANFGVGNNLWPSCLAEQTIATFEDEALYPVRLSGDREAYIAQALTTQVTAKGMRPNRQIASRWFNLSEIVRSTDGDI